MNVFENFIPDYYSRLSTRSLGRDMLLFEELDSTNAWCKRRLSEGGAPEGLAAAALCQTAGRGRLGRSWESRKGDGLYVSFVTPPLPGELLPLVPIAAGLSAAEAAEAETGLRVGIKWPNDLIVSGRKLSGILCEGAAGRAVCGIGVNLCQSEEDFLSASLPGAVSLRMLTDRVPMAAHLASEIAGRLEARLDGLLEKGAEALIPDFRRRCVSIGCRVRAVSAAGTLYGSAVDVDETGRLVIETEDGPRAVSAGEVQLRTDRGYV